MQVRLVLFVVCPNLPPEGILQAVGCWVSPASPLTFEHDHQLVAIDFESRLQFVHTIAFKPFLRII